MIKLDQCPWCKEPISENEACLIQRRRGIGSKTRYEYNIECPICGVRGPFSNTENGARILWNALVNEIKKNHKDKIV